MKRLSVLLFILCLPSVLWGAPSVTGVTGTVQDGQNITIGGSDFGSTSGVPLRWDNFDNGTTGEQIGGGWSYRTPDDVGSVLYSETSPRVAGGKFIRCSTENSDGSARWWWDSGDDYDGFYATFYIRHHTEGEIYSSNFKWVAFSHVVDFTDYPHAGIDYQANSDWNYFYARGQGESVYKGPSFSEEDYPPEDTWARIEIYFTDSYLNGGVGVDDGIVQVNALWSDHAYTWANVSNVRTNGVDATKYYSVVMFHEYRRMSTVNNEGPYETAHDMDYDDVYISDTRARVEIGNASTWAACTHREIQVPTAWATGEITATINRGSFGATDTAYLYVVDSTGAVNSSGLEITFGDTEDPAPAPPTLSNVTISGGSFR